MVGTGGGLRQKGQSSQFSKESTRKIQSREPLKKEQSNEA